jgi:hypothetical protein
MKTTHLSEDEIQQYALAEHSRSAQSIRHMEQCQQCRNAALTYQLLFNELKQQHAPVFDFDLADQVLGQLPAPKTKPVFSLYLLFAVLAFVALAAGLTAYLSAGISSLLNWLIIITFGMLAAGLLADQFASYKKKMQTLNQANLQH